MNIRLPALFALLLILSAMPCRAVDTIVKVDTDTKLISTNTGTGFKTYKVADTADIRIGNAVVTLDKLEPGMTINLGLLDSQTLNRILVVPPPAPGTPGTFVAAGRPAERIIAVKIKVDGRDAIKVKNGMLWIEHRLFNQPIDISISGHAWKPKWLDDTTAPFIGFSGPLAPFEGAKVAIAKGKGRGKVKITQEPSAQNNYTLEVEIDDGPTGGMDAYEFKITW